MTPGRTAWQVATALAAVVAICAQLDVQSASQPELARLVPGPFRSYAQEELAHQAASDRSRSRVLAETRQLVRRRPVPAESLYYLAAAQDEAGQSEQALLTLQISGQRGWRLLPTQDAMIRIAMATGDITEAANRVAALWATGAENSVRDGWTRALLTAPGGSAALAKPLAGSLVWRDTFFREAPGIAPPEQVAATFDAAARQGARFDCAELSRAALRMIRGGAANAVDRMWTRACGRNGGGGAMIGFTLENPASGPFSWSYKDTPGITVELRQAAHDVLLDYTSDANGPSRRLAVGHFRIAPGDHVLSLASGGGSGGLELIASCIDGSGNLTRIGAMTDEGEMRLTVPAMNCTAVQLELRVGRGTRQGLQLTLS